jgi:hypothetical protein
MRKKILPYFTCVLLIFLFPAHAVRGNAADISDGNLPRKGLFISLIQNPPTLSSREAMLKLVEFSKKYGELVVSGGYPASIEIYDDYRE